MIESAAIPPTHDPYMPDLQHTQLTFDTTEWVETPIHVSTDTDANTRKTTNDEIYCSMHTAKEWHRYTILGYYAVEDGHDFDIEWRARTVDPLRLHRLIWYNYLYHVDREMEIPKKLNAWAMEISQPYIQAHQVAALSMNTLHQAWAQISFEDEPMDDIGKDDANELPWQEVPLPRGKQRQDSRNRQQAADQILGQTPAPAENQSDVAMPDTPAPVTNDPQVTPSPLQKATQQSHQHADLKGSEENDTARTRAPHPHVATNDGTHRISIRWEPPDPVDTYEYDKGKVQSSISNLLKAMFATEDGKLYRWESEDLSHSKDIQKMTPVEVRDFISPTITFLPSKSQIVFGLRFGFADNPVGWQQDPSTKATLAAQHISLSMSNSKSTSGTLVTAGYILLKAPNTTHRHRYTQYLLSQLPTATPFFDVDRQSKAPNDQVIPHLAIKCGEKHVTPVCQAMVALLTGRENALFLPRYALSTMTAEQVEKQFHFHETWHKSLVEISLSPTVTHLDQVRVEYYDDGTTVRRSTREWVQTLVLEDGVTPALCDVVNGKKDRKATLLTPRHYQKTALKEWHAYRNRLYPSSHREARFRDAISDLPDEIHITLEVQSNLSFLDQMSAAAIWSKAPHNVRGSPTAERPANKTNSTATPTSSLIGLRGPPVTRPPTARFTARMAGRQQKAARANKRTYAALDTESSQVQDLEFPPLPPRQSKKNDQTILSSPDRSVASTQSLTNASKSTFYDKLQGFEALLQKHQQTNREENQRAATRFDGIDRAIKKLETLDARLTEVTRALATSATTQAGLAKTQETMTVSMAEMKANTAERIDEMGIVLLNSMEEQSTIMSSNMDDVRAQVANLTNMIQSLAIHMTESATGPRSPHKKKQRAVPSPTIDVTRLTTHEEDMEIETEEMPSTENATTSAISLPTNLLQAFDQQQVVDHFSQASMSPQHPAPNLTTNLTSSSPESHSSTTSPSAPPNLQYNQTDSAGAPDT
jgi:hypothetical protein